MLQLNFRILSQNCDWIFSLTSSLVVAIVVKKIFDCHAGDEWASRSHPLGNCVLYIQSLVQYFQALHSLGDNYKHGVQISTYEIIAVNSEKNATALVNNVVLSKTKRDNDSLPPFSLETNWWRHNSHKQRHCLWACSKLTIILVLANKYKLGKKSYTHLATQSGKNETRKLRGTIADVIPASSPTINYSSFIKQPSSSFGSFENLRAMFSSKWPTRSIELVRWRRNNYSTSTGWWRYKYNIKISQIMKMTPHSQLNTKKCYHQWTYKTISPLVLI